MHAERHRRECPAAANNLDAKLDEYATSAARWRRRLGAQLCDLRKAFVDHLADSNNAENKEKGVLTSDRCTLNERATSSWRRRC